MRGRKKRRHLQPGRERRDPRAWAMVYPELYPQVRSWFAARVACKQDADDLTGEVLARLARGPAPRDLDAYLAAAGANALARHQRHRARERNFLRRLWEETIGADEMRLWEPKELSEEGESSALHGAVEEILATLPRGQAQLLRLRFLKGLPMAEVARRLGCSRNAAYKRLRQIIQRLRERYADAPPDAAPPENPKKS